MTPGLRALLRVTAGLTLTGCVPYPLGAGDLLDTNAQVAARGDVIRPGPSFQETLPDRYAIAQDRLAMPWGALALTQVESDPQRPLVVFCGGSAFRQDVRGAETAQALAVHGDVWLFDYPGYGRSGGRGTPEDFDAMIPALASHIDQAYTAGRSGDLILWGHSFGTGVCARLAAAVRQPSTLVLIAGFRTYEDVVRARAVRQAGPFGRLIKPVIAPDMPQADLVATLAAYEGEVIVAASRQDTVVPFSASADLARRLEASGRRVAFAPFDAGDHVRFQAWPDFEPKIAETLSRSR